MNVRPATNRIAILLLPVFLFSSGSVLSQTDTLGFVNRLFECIKRDDQSGFMQLLPTHEELSELRELALKSDSTFIPPPVDSIYHEMTTKMTENFEKLLKRGEERGIAWDPVERGNLQVSISEAGGRNPIQMSNIRIELMTNDRPNALRMQVAALRGRLFLIDTVKFSY